MESDDFTRHYIIRYLSAHELVLLPLVPTTTLHIAARGKGTDCDTGWGGEGWEGEEAAGTQ